MEKPFFNRVLVYLVITFKNREIIAKEITKDINKTLNIKFVSARYMV